MDFIVRELPLTYHKWMQPLTVSLPDLGVRFGFPAWDCLQWVPGEDAGKQHNLVEFPSSGEC